MHSRSRYSPRGRCPTAARSSMDPTFSTESADRAPVSVFVILRSYPFASYWNVILNILGNLHGRLQTPESLLKHWLDFHKGIPQIIGINASCSKPWPARGD